ncbi:MAG TPA: zf-TFIIB domain-containing protein [Dehalococcoidia bacterium]|nr:zf-TFIIB domain-containing protein [Dehalococcoidia bacterium]
MTLKCPRDAAPLAEGRVHEITVAECPTCQGGWYDLPALEALERTATQDPEALVGTIEFLETDDTLACPSCGKPMQRFDYRAHDLQLDACDAEHGFWLDAGASERVREIMRQRQADVHRADAADARWQREREAGFKPTIIDRMRKLFLGR